MKAKRIMDEFADLRELFNNEEPLHVLVAGCNQVIKLRKWFVDEARDRLRGIDENGYFYVIALWTVAGACSRFPVETSTDVDNREDIV